MQEGKQGVTKTCRPCKNGGKSIKSTKSSYIHIILHMRKVSSGHLLSIETFFSIQWFSLRTAKALIRLRARAVWSGPSVSAYARIHDFVWRCPFYWQKKKHRLVTIINFCTIWICSKFKYVLAFSFKIINKQPLHICAHDCKRSVPASRYFKPINNLNFKTKTTFFVFIFFFYGNRIHRL